MTGQPGRIVGVGVASMAESGVLLDADGDPVAPVIAWHDTRDRAETDDLRAELGGEFSVRTGLPLRQQWSLTKHRWQLDHDEAAARAVRRLGVAEWIVHALGGDPVSEQSLASRTGWLDLSRRDWWDEALAWSGATRSLLPELVACGEPVGTAHDRWDVPGLAGATLTVAGHDHQAAAIGADAARLHAELDSCGTAEAFVRTVPPGLPASDIRALTDAGITVGWHALPEHWCLLGATRGGLVLQRMLALLGRGRAELPALDAAALECRPRRADRDRRRRVRGRPAPRRRRRRPGPGLAGRPGRRGRGRPGHPRRHDPGQRRAPGPGRDRRLGAQHRRADPQAPRPR